MAKPTNCQFPQIRFKGVKGEWHAKTLGSVLRIENGFAFKSKHFCDHNTGVVVLTPGSVKIGGGFQGGKGHFYKSNDGIPIKYKFQSGDIFVTMTDLTPTAQALGYPAKVPDDGVTYLHNQRLGKLVDFDSDEFFLFYLLSTANYHRIIVSTSSGTTVKHSSPLKILSIENHFPEIEEQIQIGKYFQELDRVIGLHQRKHDKLETLKKAMLQKMFPKPGSTIPEIRFKGFSEEWRDHKMGEVGLFNPKESLPEVFEYVDLESVVGTEMVSHRTETRKTAPSRAQRLARQGDLFFQTVRPYQKNNYLFTLPFSNYVFSTGYAQIRPFNDGSFLLGLMQRDQFVKLVLDNCTGTSYPAINANVLAEILVMLPKPEEQQKIGTYFRTLDTLISQHATQLQKLQQLKSACLEKMFV